MSRHLITGGTGFLGSALAHRLCDEGHRVTVLDNCSRGRRERLPAEVTVRLGDIRDYGDVAMAVAGQDVIWHLAYLQGTATFYSNPKEVIEVALVGIMNLLAACEAEEEVYHRELDLFLVSSSEAYQTPPQGMFPTDETVPLSVPDVTNPRYSYGGGKIASEIAVFAYAHAGVFKRAVIVRPHNIYGPDMGYEHVIPEFAERMKTVPHSCTPEPFHIQGTGQETRSFCYINDCIDGLMVLLEHGEDRNVYHLGNPAEEHTIENLARMIAFWWGKSIRIVRGELPKGSPRRRLPSIEKLAALGYEPKVPLSEGLVETLQWYEADERQVAVS